MGKNLNYSTTVDSYLYDIIMAADETPGTVCTFGKFQSYPDGIQCRILWDALVGVSPRTYFKRV